MHLDYFYFDLGDLREQHYSSNNTGTKNRGDLNEAFWVNYVNPNNYQSQVDRYYNFSKDPSLTQSVYDKKLSEYRDYVTKAE